MTPIDLYEGLDMGLSISDDDLCSQCTHLEYNPGNLSFCSHRWPGLFDENAYCVECPKFKQVETV